MVLLDPQKPISTCISESCKNCRVGEALHCHFTLKDLIHFYAVVLPTFLLGGAGIYRVSGGALILWVLMIIGYFGFLEIRILCAHCPHYAENASTLTCWANFGAPKIWRYRPGPMSFMEKVLFLGGFTVIWGYPLFFLLKGMQWFLLIVYVLSCLGFFMTLRLFLCSQCMNFACPLNHVAGNVRREFFEKNPDVAKRWGVAVFFLSDQ